MSEYLKLKAQIEAMNAQLEGVRLAEMEAEVTDMKRRIIAFGIRPEQLYSQEDLHGPRVRAPRVRKPPKYAYKTHSWSGEGSVPHWFRDALKEGQTRDSMLIKSGG